jgi:carnitine-CoA ligase
MALPPLEERTLLHALTRAADACPDEVAQVDRAGQWTYAECFERSRRLAGGLAALGVGYGDPVALMMDNSVDGIHAWFALSLLGAVEVPVNAAYKGRFLSHVLNDSGVSTAVVDEGYCQRLADVADEVPGLRTVVVHGGAGDALPGRRFRVVPFAEPDEAAPMPPRPVEPSDLVAYMYTSGTTGLSKGVLVPHAHAYTYSSREDADEKARPGRDDTVLVTLPTFHLAGQWYGVYQAMIHMARCVIEPGFSVTTFWDVVRRHDITYTLMLGAMAEMLSRQPPRDDDAAQPLRLAPMAPLPHDLEAFRRRFGVDVMAVYGMSEIGAVMTSSPESTVSGMAGYRRDGYRLRLVDTEGGDVPVGQVGELLVQPEVPHTVLAGYHNLPDKTAETIRDGWVHTGDAFRMDEEGRYYFTDRMKDALRRRGENISSFEVEAVINEHPAVEESAVVAVPSELGEDEIKAVVVPRERKDLDPEELTRFLVDRLPYFMVPRYLEPVAELPKTPTQKVQKHLLRSSGVDESVWDREAAGIVLRRGS